MTATVTMDFVTILRQYDEAPWGGRVKLVRHADSRWDLRRVVRAGMLREYEARQSRPIFHHCDYVVSFLGERGTRSRFLGCSKVVGVSEAVAPYPETFPFPQMPLGAYRYDLEHMPQFDDMRDRLVIDWGGGTRSWVQRLRPKPVIEILPAGAASQFPGYEDVLIEFDELMTIVEQPDATAAWHRARAAVAGVDLIVDLVSGQQYVGSASGEEGILGRWKSYARTRHGGNKLLRELLSEHPERCRQLQFSILRTLPRSMTATEVGEVESLYKRKLGTRVFGLNGN